MGCCGGDAPATPDYYSEAYQGVMDELSQLPEVLAIENAAKMGKTVVVGGKTYDFSKVGEAEYQAAYADAMSQAMLDIQKKYGAAYITQRAKELEAADPEGVAARRKLFDSVMRGVEEGTDTTEAAALESQIMQDLANAGRLTGREVRDVNQANLAQQVARGNYRGGAPDLDRATSLVNAAGQKQASVQNQAVQFLVSGVSPEDVGYRNRMQSMSNIGAFLSGETPVAQFGQLSGAQAGAAPFVQTGYGQLTNPNTAGNAANYSNQVWGAQQNWQNQQVNPWVSAASFGMQGATAGLMWGNSRPQAGYNFTPQSFQPTAAVNTQGSTWANRTGQV